MRRFTFLTASKRAQLTHMLEQRARSWASHWCMGALAPLTIVLSDGHYELDAPERAQVWRRVQRDAQALGYVRADEALPLSVLLGNYAEQTKSDAMADALRQSAHAEWLKALYAASTDEEAATAALPDCLNQRGNGFVLIDIRLGEWHHFAIIDLAAFVFTMPTSTLKATPLCARAEAVDHCQLQASVNIELGAIDVPTLASLRVGDTLVTRTSIDDMFTLTLNKRSVLAGYLGKQNQQLALQITSANPL